MHMHGIQRKGLCDPCVELAWVRLMRAGEAVRMRIEGEMKAAGFPPLTWYDVLLELDRSAEGRLRPTELESRLLLAQYSLSRLIDRLERARLVRRAVCPEDGRGQYVLITEDGRALRARMWGVYARAITEHVGSALNKNEAARLANLLAKLVGS